MKALCFLLGGMSALAAQLPLHSGRAKQRRVGDPGGRDAGGKEAQAGRPHAISWGEEVSSGTELPSCRQRSSWRRRAFPGFGTEQEKTNRCRASSQSGGGGIQSALSSGDLCRRNEPGFFLIFFVYSFPLNKESCRCEDEARLLRVPSLRLLWHVTSVNSSIAFCLCPTVSSAYRACFVKPLGRAVCSSHRELTRILLRLFVLTEAQFLTFISCF